MFNRVFNFEQNRSATSGNLPQMNTPIEQWSIPITLIRITQDIVEGDRVITETEITFKGCIQPLSAEKLQFQPEGLRSFEWLWIHAISGTLNLQTNDKIRFNNKEYKVMNIKDYSLYSYIEYEVIEDYQ